MSHFFWMNPQRDLSSNNKCKPWESYFRHHAWIPRNQILKIIINGGADGLRKKKWIFFLNAILHGLSHLAHYWKLESNIWPCDMWQSHHLLPYLEGISHHQKSSFTVNHISAQCKPFSFFGLTFGHVTVTCHAYIRGAGFLWRLS